MPRQRQLHDEYFRKAKREGYLARSAYKLTEIDDKKKILKRNDRVLDVGCAPGSWLQVAARRVGPRGIVVGIDLTPVDLRAADFPSNIRTIAADATQIDPAELRALAGDPDTLFDALISDMAPKTTGAGDAFISARLCDMLLDLTPALLRPGGNLLMKVFEGEPFKDLCDRTATLFAKSGHTKPKASRDVSRETFIFGLNYRPPTAP